MHHSAAYRTGRAGPAILRAPLQLVVERRADADRPALGRILQEMGAVAPADLLRALEMQSRRAVDLGDLLLAQGLVTQEQLAQARSRQYQTRCYDQYSPPPDPRLIDRLGVQRCLALHCLPWMQAGAVTVVATARPLQFENHRAELEALFGPVVMVLVSETDLHACLLRTRRTRLKLWAETCVPAKESCRAMHARSFGRALGGALLLVLAAALYAPVLVLAVLTCLTCTALLLSSGLKLAAFLSLRRAPAPAFPVVTTPLAVHRKPVVSILVPMYDEPEVVPRLINRLSRLTWPRELLDILLVVEEQDAATRAALDHAELPHWMRVIPVPDGKLKTKPRALNFAMLFARGRIVGVYDAEDAPEPDQIHRVVRCFQEGPPNLACVQGVLDFYNARANWISRCFSIEYASWFRIILPGMQRLGLAVPLGGTTLFFRRDILEKLGAWDAHNVTEDADLGIRLARHGYYTQLLDTVTEEEASCHPLAWVKQRSRWLKGYAITWLVHMREPVQLWRQLGAWRFFGVQVLFLGTLLQFMFAPLLWSFWLILLGFGHPLPEILPAPLIIGFVALFLGSELVSLIIGFAATKSVRHRHLRFWLLALHAYFPLAVLAVYKALWELVRAPFYWDKTAHGEFDAEIDKIRVLI